MCAPDDGWIYHPKHVEQFPDINKLCNDASCWIYIGILKRLPVQEVNIYGPYILKCRVNGFINTRYTPQARVWQRQLTQGFPKLTLQNSQLCKKFLEQSVEVLGN